MGTDEREINAVISERDERYTTTNFISLFLSLQEIMNLQNMFVICGIPDLHNTAKNHLTQLFIDSQGFTGIADFIILNIKDLHHMIKDHHLVPN